MKGYADWMAQLIEALVKLPGIGRRSAERIVFHLLKTNKPEVLRLSALMVLACEADAGVLKPTV